MCFRCAGALDIRAEDVAGSAGRLHSVCRSGAGAIRVPILQQSQVFRNGIVAQGRKAKPRVIDDCKSSGFNSAYTSCERLRLQDLGHVTAMALAAGRERPALLE